MGHSSESTGADAAGADRHNEPSELVGQVCQIGRTYAGQYLVKAQLGLGGMAEVYLIEHQILKADFALKVLRVTYRIRTDIVQRFRAECRALWELQHPNFVRVHHAGDDPEIGPHMVMEVLEGKTLHQFLQKEKVTLQHALSMGIEIADTAEAMHQLGIIHRDLKPENIFLTVRGLEKPHGLKLLDLGAAKIAKYGGPATAENRTIGTGKYMSPEHIRSQPLGPASDIYTLGNILYELISGAPVFGAHHPNPTHFDYQMWHLNAQPEPLSTRVPSAPAGLSELLAQAMAKNPEHRFQSMAAFAAALREVVRRQRMSELKGGTAQMDRSPMDEARHIVEVLSEPSSDGHWSYQARAHAAPAGTSTAEAITVSDPVSRGHAFDAANTVPPSTAPNTFNEVNIPATARKMASHTIRMDPASLQLPAGYGANAESAPPSFTQMSATGQRPHPAPTQAMVIAQPPWPPQGNMSPAMQATAVDYSQSPPQGYPAIERPSFPSQSLIPSAPPGQPQQQRRTTLALILAVLLVCLALGTFGILRATGKL